MLNYSRKFRHRLGILSLGASVLLVSMAVLCGPAAARGGPVRPLSDCTYPRPDRDLSYCDFANSTTSFAGDTFKNNLG
jgi:hypothetical protein